VRKSHAYPTSRCLGAAVCSPVTTSLCQRFPPTRPRKRARRGSAVLVGVSTVACLSATSAGSPRQPTGRLLVPGRLHRRNLGGRGGYAATERSAHGQHDGAFACGPRGCLQLSRAMKRAKLDRRISERISMPFRRCWAASSAWCSSARSTWSLAWNPERPPCRSDLDGFEGAPVDRCPADSLLWDGPARWEVRVC
jgi:hypothetical protein